MNLEIVGSFRVTFLWPIKLKAVARGCYDGERVLVEGEAMKRGSLVLKAFNGRPTYPLSTGTPEGFSVLKFMNGSH